MVTWILVIIGLDNGHLTVTNITRAGVEWNIYIFETYSNEILFCEI